MRNGIPLLVTFIALGVLSDARAQPQVVGAFAGDLQSIDQAVLEASNLTLPTTPSPAAARRGVPSQRMAKPATRPASGPAARQPTPTKASEGGLITRVKSAWGFGKPDATPASDPFQTAQAAAKRRAAAQGVSPIPAYLPQTGNVATAAYRRSQSNQQPKSRPSAPDLRERSGVKSGLFSKLFGKSKSGSPPAASTPAKLQARSKPAPPKPAVVANARSRTRPGGSTPRFIRQQPTIKSASTAPQASGTRLAARPKPIVSKPKAKPAPITTTNTFARPKPAPTGLVTITDDVPAAAPVEPKPLPIVERPLVKTTATPAPTPKPIVARVEKADKPAVDVPKSPKPSAPKIVAVRPAAPTPTPEPVSEPAEPTAERRAPEPIVSAPSEEFATPPNPTPMPSYVVTESQPAEPLVRRPLPVRPAEPAEPTARAKALLAEAHDLAATAATHEEFSAVVKRCRYVLAIDESPTAIAYANQLAGWALTKRGELLDEAGRSVEAGVDYEDALRCDPECWRAEHALGVQAARRGETEVALRRFNRTIGLNPEYAKAYSNRAALGVQAADYRGALRDYAEAIAIDPDLAVAHIGRGRVCHMLGMMHAGLRHLDAAELLAPSDAIVACGRGDLLTDLGRYGQAIAAYERAITLDPDSPTPYRNLAWTQATCPYEEFRDGSAALRNAERAEQLTGAADDLIFDTKAAALAALGRFDEAAKLQQQAIELAPESDSAAYRERLAMYERSESFTSRPIEVRQATYTH